MHCCVLECSHGKRHATVQRKPNKRKEKSHMNKTFFDLPEALKRAIWAALMADWVKRKTANRANG